MIEEIKFSNHTIGRHHKPFIIAEISGNHNQSLERALSIVRAVYQAGADAVKIQTYTADTMTLDCHVGDFYIDDPNSLWCGKSLYKLYQEAYTPWEWHASIFELCHQLGILCFSTPFDESAVDFLEQFNPPCYKIASFENTDLPLIEKVAKTNKPIIVSTGMASVGEIQDIVDTLQRVGHKQYLLLKCTSNYPASPAESNISTIPHMQQLFRCPVGISDHTLGIGVPLAAIALGAVAVEKHVTLAREDGGVDAAFSLEPNELRALVEESERVWLSIGRPNYGPSEHEHKSLQFRRTLYVGKDMKAGEIFDEQSLRRVRPGGGLPAKFYRCFLGKKIKKTAKKGTPITWDLIQ